jgi:hypothetical protein
MTSPHLELHIPGPQSGRVDGHAPYGPVGGGVAVGGGIARHYV